MGTIRTLEELARIGRQRTEAGTRSIALRGDDLDTSLLIEAMSAERITFDRLTLDGPLAIRSCYIEELVIDHIAADSVLITNSRIGRLTIRNAPLGCELTVTDTNLISLDAHSCGAMDLRRLRVGQQVQLTSLRGSVIIYGSHLGTLAIKSQVAAGRLGRPSVEIDELRVVEDVLFDDLWLSGLRLCDVNTRTLTLRRVRLDEPLTAAELRCSDTVRVNGLAIPAGDNAIADSQIQGSVELRGLENHGDRSAPDIAPAELSFHNTTLRRLTASSSEPAVISLRGSSVTGTLALPTGGTRYRLDETTNVGDMELAGQSFRHGRQAVAFLNRVFTEVSAVTLETLRNALAKRNRNREVDQLYYLTRQTEAAALPLWPRLFARGVVGGILGWGVRARNPARSMLAGFLITAAGLHAAGAQRSAGQGILSAMAAAKAVVLAAALWLNVGTGTPSSFSSPAWTALAVGFASAGLLFTTLIVGIVIRKLVR